MTVIDPRPSVVTVKGACPHDCPDTCTMVLTIEDGRLTKVRGDDDHPFTRGGLCVKVTDYQRHVYDPNRVLHPMRRTGPKGSGEFTPITWDEALSEISSRFRSVIAEHGAQAILPYSYLGQEGVLNGLTVGDPFFNQMGSSVTERTFCDGGAISAYFYTMGPTAAVDPESVVHSKYIVLWAVNTLSNNLHHWPFIEQAQRNGAKVVVIDPRRHRTAKKADWHLAIKPGTDGALALALANVMINEGLVDQSYVDDHVHGYEAYVEHVQQYTPEWAAAETGLDAADIRTLARELATVQPSLIRIGVAIERMPGGGNTVRAIAALAGLTGSFRRPGGGLLQMPIWAFPLKWDTLHGVHHLGPDRRVINQWQLGAALTGEMALDPPIKALMVWNSNPAVVSSGQRQILDGLARDDLFTVVHEQFLTDTARHADIVLPATTQVEQTDLMFSWGHLYWTYNPPAIEPLGEAVPNNELFRRLAKAMGFEDPWWDMTDEEQILAGVDWDAPQMTGITLDRLKAETWVRLSLPPADQYAPHAAGAFPTSTGKLEIESTMAAAVGNWVAPLFRQGSNDFQDGAPVAPLPTYIPPVELGQNPAYPLALVSPKPHAYLNSQYGNMDNQRQVQGSQTCTIHPDDAATRGIASGDRVKVWNDRGEIYAVAKVVDDVRPGVVVVPMGQWPSLADGGLGVNAITPTRFADIGRAPTFSDNAVEVARA